ncbi:hypothetical protein N2152v2_001482 [Parachlorella kessleri]
MSLHGMAKLGRLVPPLLNAKPTQQLRAMSLAGLKNFDERETWEENLFAKKASSPRLSRPWKEDEKALRKLLAKLRDQVEQSEPAAAAEAKQEEIAALKPLIDKYRMKAHDVEQLLAWRHSPDF